MITPCMSSMENLMSILLRSLATSIIKFDLQNFECYFFLILFNP